MKKKMKENRPDRPGYWWWEDYWGMFHVAEFDVEMETYHNNDFLNVEEIENLSSFSRWVGPAHPPKKVKVYVGSFIIDGSADGLSYETEQKRLVMLDDVEEFLIGVEDENE